MSKTQKLYCITYTCDTFLILNLLWMAAEELLYGMVQHRVVDDIVSIPILLIIYMMWKFKTERDNLIKGNRNCTKNDLLRIIKEIKVFCETGLAIKPDEEKEIGN